MFGVIARFEAATVSYASGLGMNEVSLSLSRGHGRLGQPKRLDP